MGGARTKSQARRRSTDPLGRRLMPKFPLMKRDKTPYSDSGSVSAATFQFKAANIPPFPPLRYTCKVIMRLIQ